MNSTKMIDEPDIPVAFATPVGIANVYPSSTAPAAKKTASRVELPTQTSDGISERAIRSLTDQGFPRGLAEALSDNTIAFPLRIWVVDNSGSMASTDGSRLVPGSSKTDLKYVKCSRWNELQETVEYHATMAATLKAPTNFRLLNYPGRVYGPQQFGIAQRGDDKIDEDLQVALKCMQSPPGGLTPLTDHIREIRENILELEPTLRQNTTKVAIILATDGLPTSSSKYRGDPHGYYSKNSEQEFVEALKSLEGLPVWVVIRLCTDDDNVVSFYNDLDAQLEYSLEVLDDFEMEAKEIYQYNKFLNYALPLHRCREMGYHHRLFDYLDERQLSVDELRDLFTLLFGQEQMAGVPDAHSDWKGFLQAIKSITDKEDWQWDPIKKKAQPWVNIKKLDRQYHGGKKKLDKHQYGGKKKLDKQHGGTDGCSIM